MNASADNLPSAFCARHRLLPPGVLRPACGFTLVELLVVVAIIGILVVMLVPSARGIMEYGWDVQCKTNLRNLSQALHDNNADVLGSIDNSEMWMSFIDIPQPERILMCPKGYYEGQTGGVFRSSGITEIAPPPLLNQIESKTDLYGFVERVNYSLPRDLTVDISKAGQYKYSHTSTQKVIPRGTVVDCYYLLFDPSGDGIGAVKDERAITVPGKIIGVIVKTDSLNRSDGILGRPDTKYPTGESYYRGYEDGQEVVSVSGDLHTYTVHSFNTPGAMEHTRIVTLPGQLQRGSYAINGRIDTEMPRHGQLMLVEYDQSLVDTESPDHAALVQPRHFDKVNVLFVDGSVRAVEPEKLDPNSELWEP